MNAFEPDYIQLHGLRPIYLSYCFFCNGSFVTLLLMFLKIRILYMFVHLKERERQESPIC